MTGGTATDSEALAAKWDLSPLVDGQGDAGVDSLLDRAATQAAQFVQNYTDRLSSIDSAELIQAMLEYGEIRDLIQRASVYSQLRFATDSGDPVRGALVQHAKERVTELETELQFFELEWTALDPEAAERLLVAAGPALDFAAQYLRTQQRRRRFTLSAPEERVLAERELTGQQAWSQLFEQEMGALEVDLGGESVPFTMAYNQWRDQDRAKRVEAVNAMSTALTSGLDTRTYILNTLLQDKAVEDRLRGYPTWLSSRNIENQIEDSSVQALVEAVKARYDLPVRWFRIKAWLLGLERLTEADISAPALADARSYPYLESRDLVLSAYNSLSSEVGNIARRFFDENWIDAPVRANKMGGAFCETGGPNLHPYVLLNHSGRRDDAFAMAHELGHGIHDVLAARAGIFHQQPPMSVAETASTFGESLLLQTMLGRAVDDRERLSLLAAAVDQSVFTIFLQIAYNQFEESIHTERRASGALSSDRVDHIYLETTGAIFGDAVDRHPGMERFWSMVPHFYLWPGYVYAYAYGQLFSLSIYARYQDLGSAFVPSYLELLAAGGSRPPAQLGRLVGIDLDDVNFWSSGLDLVEAQLRAVEELAATTGAIE